MPAVDLTSRATAAPTTLIVRAAPLGGFMSNFNMVLNHLVNSLGRDGVEAVRVDWSAPRARQKNFSYGTDGDGNLWECFFEPLPFDAFPTHTREVRGFADDRITAMAAYLHVYKLARRTRGRYHDAYARYIRVRPEIRARVDAWHAAELRGVPTIGVHYRNQRHSHECPEPIPAVSVFVARVESLLNATPGAKVFLATDVEDAVTQFERAFGDRLVVQRGATRAQGASDAQVHHAHQAPAVAMGTEVLVDCLMLARCDTVLHVTSNVASAVSWMNPRARMRYVERSTAQGLAFYAYRTARRELGAVLREKGLRRS